MSVVRTVLRPAPPYDLRRSVWGDAGRTRRWHGDVLELAYAAGGGRALARVRQRRDGDLQLRVEVDGGDPAAALERLRFLLAADVDHVPFLRRARRDPLLREVALRTPGMRPARLGSVAHALVAAVCGQLVTWGEARRLERAVVSMATGPGTALRPSPTTAQVAALAPARAAGAGLAARRALAMVRLARGLDLERMHAMPTGEVVARIGRERDLGPWSAGVMCIYGLGRYDHGLVGDLGLMRLLAAVHGRWPEPADTARLLEPWGEWAGLASAYLMAHPAARRTMPGGTFRRAPLGSGAGRPTT